jgi:hypothetical protein
MPIQPDRYIQCQRDGYIPVRTFDGKLLGCIPGNPPREDFLQTPIGSVVVCAGIVYGAAPGKEQLARLHE